MKTDYITSGSTLLPCLAYPRFLLTADMKLIDRVVYAVLLDEAPAPRTRAGWTSMGGCMWRSLPTTLPG